MASGSRLRLALGALLRGVHGFEEGGAEALDPGRVHAGDAGEGGEVGGAGLGDAGEGRRRAVEVLGEAVGAAGERVLGGAEPVVELGGGRAGELAAGRMDRRRGVAGQDGEEVAAEALELDGADAGDAGSASRVAGRRVAISISVRSGKIT